MKSITEYLDHLIVTRSNEIENWFAHQWQNLNPLPYFSCDIRHAGYKIGIVDTNLFPGGFNNLCDSYSKDAQKAMSQYLESYPHVKNIALLAETHTRNKFYLLNVLKIKSLLESCGKNVRVTMSLEAWPQSAVTIDLSETDSLTLYQPQTLPSQHENTVSDLYLGDDFKVDFILSNNDFSAGLPNFLIPFESLIAPHPDLGWHKRRKHTHFDKLKALVNDFGNQFDLDPWLLCPDHIVVDNVAEDNLEPLALAVEKLLTSIQTEYQKRGVTDSPYVFVKNASGTYGLGVISVFSGDEIRQLNRKKREKLFASKQGAPTNTFLIQEGVPTIETYSDFPIEPVIYGIGAQSVGGFFRIHEGKNNQESLNAPGMTFSCLCLHSLDKPHENQFIDCQCKSHLVRVARFLARFASLSASLEAQ